jgi:hypothetical protein
MVSDDFALQVATKGVEEFWMEGRVMESYYIMHRTGKFKPAAFSTNQCKAPRHEDYHYELVMVF